MSTQTIHINVNQIPSFRKKELAEGALALMEQVFSEPGAEERYQAWLRKRHAKNNEKGG